MTKSANLTPLTEYSAIASQFPEVAPVEQIGLHERHIGWLAGLGYFDKSRIAFGGYREAASNSTPGISGVFDGIATASQVIAGRHPRLGKGNPEQHSATGLFHDKTGVTLCINVKKVEEQVRATPNHRLRDPKVWAHYTHKAFGDALVSATRHHLTSIDSHTRLEIIEELGMQMLTRGVLVSESNYRGIELLLRSAATGIVFGSAVRSVVGALEGLLFDTDMQSLRQDGVLRTHARLWSKACYSLIPIAHWDRVGLVALGTRWLKLADVIE